MICMVEDKYLKNWNWFNRAILVKGHCLNVNQAVKYNDWSEL